MLKNLYLSLSFLLTAFPLATLPFCKTAQVNNVLKRQKTLEHIARTKKSILFEAQIALLIINKTQKHFQELLPDTYESIKRRCIDLLHTIVASPEFTTTIEQVTDQQVELIINQFIKYEDLFIDSTEFPLEQKVKSTLSQAAFDENSEQLFNIFYTMFAIIKGSEMLMHKLDMQEKALTAELERLQASDQTS